MPGRISETADSHLESHPSLGPRRRDRQLRRRHPGGLGPGRRHTATLDGGGVYDVGGILTLDEAAQVTGNIAVGSGGGIYQLGGTLTLDGTSHVTGNTTAASGGGIYSFGTFYACATWTGAISPNTPDDPPTPTQVGC